MRTLSWASIALLFSACTVTEVAPRSWLDPRSAVTVTVQQQPIVFAFEEPMRAAAVRDYVQAGAAEINRIGERNYYLVLLSWSTIDRSAQEHERIASTLAAITVRADDRAIQLQRAATERASLGVGRRFFSHPTPGTRESYYAVTKSELAAMADARTLSITADGIADQPVKYQLWRDGRLGLARFLAEIPEPRR